MANGAEHSITVGNLRKPLNHSDGDELVTAWRGVDSYCLQNTGGNTGQRGYRTLQLYNTANGQGLGVSKPNTPGRADYVPPISDTSACPIPAQLSVSPQTLSLGSAEYIFDLEIESNAAWQISNSSPGLSFNKLSGSGNDTVSVVVAPNDDSFELTKSFLVSATDGTNSKTVSLTQVAFDPSTFEVSPTALSFGDIGGSQTINVITGQTWTFSDNLPWAQVSRSGDILTVSVNQNFAGSRSGSVTIQGDLSSASVPVSQEAIPVHSVVLYGRGTVVGQFDGADTPDEAMGNLIRGNVFATTTQENIGIGTRFFHDNSSYTPINGSDKWYKIDDTFLAVQIDSGGYFLGLVDTEITLGIAPTSASFPEGGGSRGFQITSDTGWSVTNSPSWISISGGAGSGNGNFTATAQPNTGQSQRSGNIRVTSSNGQRIATATVTQTAAAPITLNPTSTTIPQQGGTFALQILTPREWSIILIPPTPGFSTSQNSGFGDSFVTVTVPANTAPGSILMSVQVVDGPSGGSVFCDITVEGPNNP